MENVKWPGGTIGAYAGQSQVHNPRASCDGIQSDDPAKLGEALIKVSGMGDPPMVFVAGRDALEMIGVTLGFHKLQSKPIGFPFNEDQGRFRGHFASGSVSVFPFRPMFTGV